MKELSFLKRKLKTIYEKGLFHIKDKISNDSRMEYKDI